MLRRFAFTIYPIEPQKDVVRMIPLLGRLPPGVIDYLSCFFPAACRFHITDIRSEAKVEEVKVGQWPGHGGLGRDSWRS